MSRLNLKPQTQGLVPLGLETLGWGLLSWGSLGWATPEQATQAPQTFPTGWVSYVSIS